MKVAAPCLVLGKGDWEDRRTFSSMLSSAPVGQGLCAVSAPAGAVSHGTCSSSPGLHHPVTDEGKCTAGCVVLPCCV